MGTPLLRSLLPAALRAGGALLAVLLLPLSAAFGQAVFTYTGGAKPWAAATSWTKTGDATAAAYPGQTGAGSQTHRVVIGSGTVTLSQDITALVSTVTISGGGGLVLAGNHTLATTGSVATGATGTASVYVQGSGSLQVSGAIILDTLSLTGNGNVFVKQNFDISRLVTNVITGANAEVIFNGTGTQNIVQATAFQKLRLANTSNPIIAGGVITVQNATAIPTGTRLDLGTRTGHTLGNVSGSGTLRISGASNGAATWPGGTFSGFLTTATGGTVEYYGDEVNFSISAVPFGGFNDLVFTGQGRRSLMTPVTVRGNLTIDDQDTLRLQGTTTLTLAGGNLLVNGALNGGTGSTVRLTNTASGQSVGGAGSIILRDLILDKGGRNTTLLAPVRINGTLTFNSAGKLIQGANDITLGEAARVTGNIDFGPTAMIEQDGTAGAGSLIKESATAAGFVQTGPGSPVLFPVGSGGVYAPAQITLLAATVNGTASVSVKTIPLTAGTDVLRRVWRVQTAGLTAITDARIQFGFDGAEIVGSPDYVTRSLNGTYYPVEGSFYSGLIGRQTFGVNAPGNLYLDEIWGFSKASALPRTYYSYLSGPYDAPGSWTTDPSGSVQINKPATGGPTANDAVVILPGHTIVMATGGKTLASVFVNEGGVLDADTTGRNVFGNVGGRGTLRLARLALPTGFYDAFVSAQGGTIEYADVTGTLPAGQLTYNNLSLAGTGIKTVGATGTKVYRINGNLTVRGGQAIIGGVTGKVYLSVARNLTVAAGASLTTGTASSQHTLDIAGSLINNGTVKFTNRTPPFTNAYSGAPTNGYVRVRFLGSANNVATCNGPTDFHSIEVQKGNDPTYTLTLTASDTANFNLLGGFGGDSLGANAINSRSYSALATRYGTVVLGQNIRIAALTNGQWRVNAGAGLVIDGAKVHTFLGDGGGGGQAFLIYGRFTMRNGYLSAGESEGIVVRGAGEYIQSGGLVQTTRFRPSVITSTIPRSLFDMSGGRLDCHAPNFGQGFYGTFSLPYPNNVFKMSGGEINVRGTSSGGQPANMAFQVGAAAGNVTVTGGTVNLRALADARGASNDMGIASTAPLYNVNAYTDRNDSTDNAITISVRDLRYADDDGNYTVAGLPLVVLNSFHVIGKAYFRCFNSGGVRVGGNATFDAGSRFDGGTSRFVMGGTPAGMAAQVLAMAKPMSFAKLAFANMHPGGTVTLAGFSPRVTDTLSIDAGTLNDNGLTITAAGSAILNSARHTGAGRILANGGPTAAGQSIGGSGAGVFGNLVFASADSLTRSFRFTANQTVADTLALISGLVNLQSFNLHLRTTATLRIAQPYTLRRAFTSGGISTDGGVTSDYAAGSPSTPELPFVHNGGLRRVIWGSVSAGSGSVRVVPVIGQHPSLTAPALPTNDAAKFYWRVFQTGAGANTLIAFTYLNADLLPAGRAEEDSNFVVGRYTNQNGWATSAYTTQDNNSFAFTGPQGGDVTGDYTVGRARVFGGTYSFESIASGDFNAPGTWRRTQNGTDVENPATSLPNANTPIVIHQGHTVRATAAGGVINVPSIRIDSAAVLDLDTTSRPGNVHNFNLVYAGQPSSGTIRLSGGRTGLAFPKGDYASFLSKTGGTVRYYGSGQNFTLPAATGNGLALASYRRLELEPGANTITTAAADAEVYEDLTILPGTGTVALATTPAGDLTVDRDLIVGAGAALRFGAAGSARQLTVVGDVRNAGRIGAAPAGALNHLMAIGGSIANNGMLNMQPGTAAQTHVTVMMMGTGDARIEGTGDTTSFSQLIINKGTGAASVVEATATAFSLAGDPVSASKPLLLQNGTFKLSAARTLTVSTGASADLFQIPPTAGLWVAGGKVLLTGTGANAGLQLDGTLKLTGPGIVRLDGGNVAGTDNSIQYGSTGQPAIDMAGDSLIIGGQIRGNARAASGSLVYSQSRGAVWVGTRNAATSIKPMFEVVNGGNFLMSGGDLVIARSRGNISIADMLVQPADYTVTGGRVVFGLPGANSPAGTVFSINATAPVYDLAIYNLAGSAPSKLKLYTSPLQTLGSTVIDINTVLDANNIDVRFGGPLTYAGSYLPGANTTYFNGATGDQGVNSTQPISFYNVQVNNRAPSGKVVIASGPWTITRNLDILAGTLEAGGVDVTLLGNVTNSGRHTSTTGALVLAGSIRQDIGGSGAGVFGSLRINNASSARALAGFTVTGILDLANGLLDMQAKQLTLGPAALVSGSFSAARMIRTSGASDDNGVTKQFASGAVAFTFPVGAENHYTPATYALSATTGGSITVRPVNRVHPLSSAPDNALNYYWSVSSTGLAGATGTQVYTYDQASASGRGNEGDYAGAHLTVEPQWELFPNTVDVTANTITLTDMVVYGEVTAGEASSFAPIVPYRSAQSGPWSATTTWEDGAVPILGSVVRIRAGHTVTLSDDNTTIGRLRLDSAGKLDVGTTTGVGLGDINGSGTLAVSTPVLPAAAYNLFTSANGGTIEFDGGGYALPPSRTVYNNLRINASGIIENVDALLTLNGNLTVAAGSFANNADRAILVQGDLVNNGTFVAGTAASTENLELRRDFVNNGSFFTGGAGVVFNGEGDQRIKGSSPATFGRVQVSKAAGTLGVSTRFDVYGQLVLDHGLIRLDSADLVLQEAALVRPDVITPASYVWASEQGKLIRKVATAPMPVSSAYTLLPVGDETRYLPFTFRLKQGTLAPDAQVALNVRPVPHPKRGAAARYLTYYWQLAPAGISGPVSYDVRYRISSRADIQVDSAADTRPIMAAKYGEDSTWTYGGSYDSTQLAFYWSDLSSFSDFTAGSGLGDSLPQVIENVRATAYAGLRAAVVPNPGHANQLRLLLAGSPAGAATYTITDSRGQVVARAEALLTGKDEIRLDAARHLAPGLYLVTVQTQASLLARRFIIE